MGELPYEEEIKMKDTKLFVKKTGGYNPSDWEYLGTVFGKDNNPFQSYYKEKEGDRIVSFFVHSLTHRVVLDEDAKWEFAHEEHELQKIKHPLRNLRLTREFFPADRQF